jgi:hypothetical protein
MPLLEDASRFVILALRQRDLATRLAALKDQEQPRDPASRTRMRDLQAEQEEIRAALGRLLDDIEDHLAKLPDEKELDEFRESVRKFVVDVRGSGAGEAMSAAETALAEFSGKRGYENADRAADILEKFIERCQSEGGMMGLGMRALRFQPGLAAGLGNTVAQLLSEAGLVPGEGMGGSGSGGRSARRGAATIGLYGSLPGVGDATGLGPIGGGRSGSGRDGAGARGGTQPGEPAGAAAGRPPGAPRPGDVAVPAAYRRRVAEYFQRVAEETGGK